MNYGCILPLADLASMMEKNYNGAPPQEDMDVLRTASSTDNYLLFAMVSDGLFRAFGLPLADSVLSEIASGELLNNADGGKWWGMELSCLIETGEPWGELQTIVAPPYFRY